MAADSVGQIGLDLVVNDKSFNKQMAGIQGMAKKAGAALAAAFAVKKIADFSAQCIELGSRLAEVDNVIQQAIPSMEKQIDSFAKNAIQQFGMSETAAKKFTGVFASMARGFGFAEESAASMGMALTGLAADVASFYDTSQDEAYTKLKSIFTGETETLKDLGIVMTQSALDSYALANGYGKVTAKMSEAEKVALRYAFVQEKLRFAQGDFARTSGSWANQVRILTEQFNALKATIGQGLINVLTPVIQVINTIIGKLMSLANAFKAFTEMVSGKKSGGGASAATTGLEAMADSADKAGAAATGAGGAAKKAARDMKGMSTGIDELNIIQAPDDSGSGGSGGDYAADEFDMGGVDTGTSIPEPDISGIENAAQKIKAIFNGLKKFFAENKNTIIAMIGGLIAGIAAYFTASNWAKIIGGVATAFSGIKAAVIAAISGISVPALAIAAIVALIVAGIIDLWNTSDRFRDNMRQAWDLIATAFKSAWSMIWNDGLKPLGSALADLGKTIYSFYETSGLKTLFEFVITGITWVASILGSVLITAISAALTVILQAITALVQALTWIVDQLTWLFGNWSTIWESIKDLFSEVWEQIKETASNAANSVVEYISEKWAMVKDVTSRIWEGIKKLISDAMSLIHNVISTVLNAIKSIWQAVWDAIKEKVSGVIEDIRKGIEEKITAIKTKWDEIWDGIKDKTSEVWDGIKGIIKGTIDAVVTGVEAMVNAVIKSVNWMISQINKISIDIPDTPFSDGFTIGFDIPKLSEVKLPRVSWLAQGGFVKANTPQLAMIGDNKRYGEIVAPEDKMQAMVDKAVAMASGNSSMSDQYLAVMVDLLKKIIELIEDLDLTVNLDTREIKKKLVDLEKRSGYTMRPAQRRRK